MTSTLSGIILSIMMLVDQLGLVNPQRYGLKEFQPLRKIWRKNTNFENPSNWIGLMDKICFNDIYTFPPFYWQLIVVAMGGKILPSQIILPLNGHFVFRNGVTTLSESTTCQKREVVFKRQTRANWLDPSSWKIHPDIYTRLTENDMNTVPHVETVPCQYDSVQFPSQSSFYLRVSTNVTVNSFFLGNKEVTNIDHFLGSKLGLIQFERAEGTKFEISKKACGDNNDCICGNYDEKIRMKICSFVKCNVPSCPNPTVPIGFCCPVCLSYLKIFHNGNIKLTRLQSIIYRELKKQEKGTAKKIGFFVTGVNKNLVQVTLNLPDKQSGENGLLILQKLEDLLKTGMEVVRIEKAVAFSTPQNKQQEGSRTYGGFIVFIVMLLLLILSGIGCAIYVKSKNGANSTPWTQMIPEIYDSIRIRINTWLSNTSNSSAEQSHSFAFARFTNERISNINISSSNVEVANEAEEDNKNEKTGDENQKDGSDNFNGDHSSTSRGSKFTFSNPTYEPGKSETGGAQASENKAEAKAQETNSMKDHRGESLLESELIREIDESDSCVLDGQSLLPEE